MLGRILLLAHVRVSRRAKRAFLDALKSRMPYPEHAFMNGKERESEAVVLFRNQ